MKEKVIQMVQGSDNTAQLEIVYMLLSKPYDAELCEIIYQLLKQS